MALLVGLAGASGAAASTSASGAHRSSHASRANKGSLSVALVTDLTGEDAPSRKPFNEGVIAYFKTHSTIAGHKVSVNIFNGQYNPAIAPAVFRQAVSSKPAGIIDFVVSTSTQTAEPVLASANIPCLCVGGSTSWYGPKPYPWAFTANPTINDDARAYVKALTKVLGGSLKGKRIAISGDKTAFLTLIASELKALAIHDGATFVSSQWGNTSETSWSGEAADIAQAKPDAVFSDTIGSAQIVQIKALETAGLTKTPIVAFPGLQYSDMTALKLPNLYLMTSWPYGAPKSSAVYKAAKKLGYLADETSYEFEFGWAQAAVLAHALAKCNACTGTKLEATLEKLKNYRIPGHAAFGTITFSKKSHSTNIVQALLAWDAKANKLRYTVLNGS